MTQRNKESSQSLVGDLLRRATSPEVLGGVAGAAAAARFTKQAVAQSDDDEPDTPPEPDREAPPAEAGSEPHDDSAAEEADDDTQDEPEAVGADEADADEDDGVGEEEEEAASRHDEAEAEAEPETDESQDEPSDESSGRDGSLGDGDEVMQLLARARRYAEQLTGHRVESFSGLAQDEQGWRVGMEVVEVSRVPSTTDVIASYEVVLTGEGELVDFRRARRYYRNATDEASE